MLRRRIYVGTQGSAGSLDAYSSPGLRDVETMIVQHARPLPREVLVLLRRALGAWGVRTQPNSAPLDETDIQSAIHWYSTDSSAPHQNDRR